MRFEGRFDIFALFMLLGISQGIFLIYYYLNRKNRKDAVNRLFGMMLIAFLVISSEILLNYTGLIVRIIQVENYSEPFIFLVMPLLYLMIRTNLNEPYSRRDHVHFFPFVFYFLYCILYFLQPPEFKYNSYVYCYQPEWDYLDVTYRIPDDPLGLRDALAPLYIFQALVYLYMIIISLKHYPASITFRFIGPKDPVIRPLFAYWYHAAIVTVLIIFVKTTFDRDLGDYLIGSYISILLYISGFVVLSRILNRQHAAAGEDNGKPKYEKSSLTESQKEEILGKLGVVMSEKKYFTRNMLSLSDVARAAGVAPHHLSQVINEKLGKGFFDVLSEYRIEEAKRLLHDSMNDKLTIEEIAERVGYNSKAAFNKAFKQLTGTTPSEFRKNF